MRMRRLFIVHLKTVPQSAQILTLDEESTRLQLDVCNRIRAAQGDTQRLAATYYLENVPFVNEMLKDAADLRVRNALLSLLMEHLHHVEQLLMPQEN